MPPFVLAPFVRDATVSEDYALMKIPENSTQKTPNTTPNPIHTPNYIPFTSTINAISPYAI